MNIWEAPNPCQCRSVEFSGLLEHHSEICTGEQLESIRDVRAHWPYKVCTKRLYSISSRLRLRHACSSSLEHANQMGKRVLSGVVLM